MFIAKFFCFVSENYKSGTCEIHIKKHNIAKMYVCTQLTHDSQHFQHRSEPLNYIRFFRFWRESSEVQGSLAILKTFKSCDVG